MCTPQTDFGASRFEQRHDMTADTSTPLFSAPEQLARRPYSVSVDVWAYGCCIACLFCNVQSPYETGAGGGVADAGDDFLIRVERGQLVPVLDPRHGPPDAVRIVETCCRHSESERPAITAVMSMLHDGVGEPKQPGVEQ